MAGTAITHSRRFLVAVWVFIVLYPLSIYPQYLLSQNGFFIFDGELVHLIPRLIGLTILVLLGWRFWRLGSFFATLIVISLGLVLVGSLNARDPDGLTYSLIGPSRRMDGLYYQALLAGLAISVYWCLRQNLTSSRTLIWVVLLSAGCQATLIWLQRFGLDPIGPLVVGHTSTVLFGTLGHPGVAASFLLLAVVLAIPLVLDSATRPQRLVALALILFSAAALGFTENRASAYAVALVLALGVFVRPSLYKLGLHTAVVICIFVPQMFLPNVRGHDRDYTDTYTLKTRLEIWRLSLEALRHIPGAPWIGGGPDALNLALLRNIPPEKYFQFLKLEESWPPNARIESTTTIREPGAKLRETTYKIQFAQYGESKDYELERTIILNKSHNLLLERLLSYGIFSSLIWLLLYLYPVWAGLRSSNPDQIAMSWTLLALSIYYLGWFPTVQVEPLHMLVVAAAWAFLHAEKPDPKVRLRA